MDYSKLLPFCNTDKQREVLEACVDSSPSKAAEKLGMDPGSCRKMVRRIKERAARAGIAPEADMTKPAAEGYYVNGVSSLYDQNGELKAQWVKTSVEDAHKEKALQAAVDALKEGLEPYAPLPCPKTNGEDLVNQYTITDYHLGMYAWHEESGEDWNLHKAEELLTNWFAYAVKNAPDAKTGIFAQLGDFLHWDGMDAVTPSHGHLLDADTRFQKVIRCCIRVIRRCIAMLLEKHERVHVIMAVGNHDLASSAWMRELFSAVYDQEPRITIDRSPDAYYCYQHGKTCLMYHHGHKRKVSNISEVLAAKFKKNVFGSDHVYSHLGHLHHNEVKETALMIIEQHRTLAPKDAYAAAGGWMSGRDAKVITYSKEMGEVSRLVISPERVSNKP